MKPIRMYMNSYEEAIEFIERIRPVCSKVFIPSKIYWDNFSNIGHQDMISTTINYKEPTIRIEIMKNEYKAKVRDVLDKIRAEIEQLPTKTRTNWDGCCPDIDYPEIEYVDVTKDKLLDIIDKYQEADLIDATYKALEEEICEDAISRKDMALNIVSFYNKATGKKKTLDFLCKCVEGLPSVQPKQRWIPVGERLPKDDERILVTRRMFHWANEPVEYAVGIESFSGNVDFIAWMPLPEPYKAEIEPQEK